MKKFAIFMLAVAITLVLGACEEKSKPENQKEEPSKTEQSSKEKGPESIEEPVESKISEVKEESKEPTAEMSTQIPQETQETPIISFVAYDYMGLSHKAVITDTAMINRIMDCFNYSGTGTDEVTPMMGGAMGFTVEQNGVTKEYIQGNIFNGEDVFVEGLFSDKKYYYIKDKTLVSDLLKTYQNDENKAEPEYSYEMNVVYNIIESTGEGSSIQGELGRAGIAPGNDMERLKKVISSNTIYSGNISDLEKTTKESISVEIQESRDFKSYDLFKLTDGTVLCKLGYHLSDKEELDDNNFYVVSDNKIYDYLVSTYFPNVKSK